jgi:hypothetical protein
MRRPSFSFFWLMFWFDFAATWFAAAVTALADWRPGWFFAALAAAIGILFWRYNPEELYRKSVEDERDLARTQVQEMRAEIIDHTDRCLDENGVCRMCGSRHSKLPDYPFDIRLHYADCKVSPLRARYTAIEFCPPELLHEVAPDS